MGRLGDDTIVFYSGRWVGGVARNDGEGDAGEGFSVGSWHGVRSAMAREVFRISTSREVDASSKECRLAAGETIAQYNEMACPAC